MKNHYLFIALFSTIFLFTQCSEDLSVEPTSPNHNGLKVDMTSIYRGVYLDSLKYIVGDQGKENSVLQWCQYNNFTTVTCYDLYTLLATSAGYPKVAAFIRKAREQYGITTVTACMGSASAFSGMINTYNNSRTDSVERFNYSNLELEWWNKAATYKKYLSELQGIKAWGDAKTPRIPTETYIGWFQNPTGQELTQATGIVNNTDRVLVHAYQTIPTFNYMKSRLQWLGKAAMAQNKVQKVVFLFSAEPSFSFNYFVNNSFDQTFLKVLSEYEAASFTGKDNLEIIGYQIFAQSEGRAARPLMIQ
ncbi:MAG: hypothetical protein ACOVQ4_06310 [Flectobacillus sp.]|uniref:hypothetical protein n=1 Tax=Flectobacillus sp. TaxID=50419 RepID=UPI003B9AE7C4